MPENLIELCLRDMKEIRTWKELRAGKISAIPMAGEPPIAG